MGFDIDINLKWFRGISKWKKNLRPLLATEHAKLGLVMNWIKFDYTLTSKRDNLTFYVNICNLILLFS